MLRIVSDSNVSDSHFSNVVMPTANLDQLRCTPVFRDVGKEEKREGFIFGHFVSLLTHRPGTHIYEKCILHNRGPLK